MTAALDGADLRPHRAAMASPETVTGIAHTIQASLAPVFLLTGIGGFLNVIANRLGRVIDRARVLEQVFTPLDDPMHAAQVRELRALDRRIVLSNSAIFLATASAIAVCVTIAFLFVSNFSTVGGGRAVSIAFVVAMALLVAGLLCFLAEVRVAAGTIRLREDLLELERKRR